MGQLAGDSLGSLVEFQSPGRIRRAYPDGVRELADGGTWKTLAGQPTDDSELALALARTLVDKGTYDAEATFDAYVAWLNSGPFDCGNTIAGALRGQPNPASQANGAMMRVSPLGIFGANHPLETVAGWAEQDAALTHRHRVCRQANALYAMAIADAVANGTHPQPLYGKIVNWAADRKVDPTLAQVITLAADTPPEDFTSQQGWVLVAFRNALWQLLHAKDCESGIVDTVGRGGDTDTNGAICGALLGAVYGIEMIPAQWTGRVLHCRPKEGDPRVLRPRPECYWPVDALELADALIGAGA
jgi:ADP-ribosylglycohydrolase